MDRYILSGQHDACVCLCVFVYIEGMVVGEGGQRRLIEVPSKKWEREKKKLALIKNTCIWKHMNSHKILKYIFKRMLQSFACFISLLKTSLEFEVDSYR